MNGYMAGVARAAAETFAFPEPILEIGSLQVDGAGGIGELRGMFPGKKYIGVDMRPGPGVDSVESVEALPRPDKSVGSVIALSVFEHVEHFWRGFEEVQRTLRPDGLLLVSVPFNFHIHNYPYDYWRFTPDAFRSLLREMPTKIIGQQGPKKRPLMVWALAAGPKYPTITEAQHVQFRTLIKQYAKQPMRWKRKITYGLGRLICGKGPFAPYFEAETFESHLERVA